MRLSPKLLARSACATLILASCGGSTDESATVPDDVGVPSFAPASDAPVGADEPSEDSATVESSPESTQPPETNAPETTTTDVPETTGPPTSDDEATDPPPSTTVPATTDDSTTTPDVGPDEEVLESIVVPPGEFVVGPGDLVVLRTNGDLELSVAAVTDGAAAEAVRLLDNVDPRVEVAEGPGPNAIDDVAGFADGSLVFGDCCEPVAGNISALPAVGDERIQIGFGYSPNLSPDGTKLATGNSFALAVADISTGQGVALPVNEDPDADFVDIDDLEWVDDDTLAVLRSTGGTVELVVTDASTLGTFEVVELAGLFDGDRLRFAGRTFDGLIGVAIAGPGRSEVRYFDPQTWTEVAEVAQEFPAEVSFVEIDAGGLGQVWVDENELFFLPTGEFVARSLGDEVIAAWFVGQP